MTIGSIAWQDLTVQNADEVRDFYSAVVGWKARPVDMDGYQDYSMITPETAEGIAGVCHARGANEGLPAQWLIYIIVEDVEKSAATCTELGGEVLVGPREMGEGQYCVIRDPAGAVCALFGGRS